MGRPVAPPEAAVQYAAIEKWENMAVVESKRWRWREWSVWRSYM